MELGVFCGGLVVLKLIKDSRGSLYGYVVGANSDVMVVRMVNGTPQRFEMKKGDTTVISVLDMCLTLSQVEYNGCCKSSTGRDVNVSVDTSSTKGVGYKLVYKGPRDGDIKIDDLEIVSLNSFGGTTLKYLKDSYGRLKAR